MAKGQHLTPFQQGIVKRYYQHKETMATQKLGEIVSELYFEGRSKRAGRLWKSAETAMINAGANKFRVAKIVEGKDLKALAELTNELF